MTTVLAIDGGNIESGIAVIDEKYRPLYKGKLKNDLLYCDDGVFDELLLQFAPKKIVIEMISNYGSAVGSSVFQTCIEMGKMHQYFINNRSQVLKGIIAYQDSDIIYVKRKQYITDLCDSPKANDASVKTYLVDRFAQGVSNYGKGSKTNPGWFYGFSKDAWSAYAIAVWYMDLINNNIAHI